MIAYFDSSALVKRVMEEPESTATAACAARADRLMTVVISRAEVAAALAQAVRLRRLTLTEGRAALRQFAQQWDSMGRIDVDEVLVEQAVAVAWEHHLRGYDAIQLAAALDARETFPEPVLFATFDRQLSEAAARCGFPVWPELPAGTV